MPKPRATVILTILLPILGSLMLAAADRPLSVVASARQVVIVTTPDWNATTGKLQRYSRIGKHWKSVGSPIPIVVGRNGMGWSLVLQAEAPSDSPTKREGDGRSPAGVFAIGAAFGFDPNAPAWLKLPYIPLTPATECVDDSASSYYNSVIHRIPSQPAAWRSSEKMRQIDQYQWGVIIDQNSARMSGAGSCIFLHIWSGPTHPTAGCIAMEQNNLQEVMRWLDRSAKPVLVALPVPLYQRVRRQWGLPE